MPRLGGVHFIIEKTVNGKKDKRNRSQKAICIVIAYTRTLLLYKQTRSDLVEAMTCRIFHSRVTQVVFLSLSHNAHKHLLQSYSFPVLDFHTISPVS